MSDEHQIAALETLGADLRALGEPPARGHTRVTRRTLLIALVLVVLLAGAATAAILITRGAPLPAPNSRDLAASGVPIAASAHLAGLDAPDPEAGEPVWDMRISRTAAGETCTAVGQVVGGQFGIVGLDHVFRALPLGGVDACGVPSPDGPLLAGARVFVGADASSARTIVDGVAGPGARSVVVDGPDGARRLRLGPDGSFLTVYRGYVEEVRPRILIALRNGRERAVQLAQSVAYEVPDPSGRYAWQASGGPDLGPGAYPDENCAQASELLGRNNPSEVDTSLTPIFCGRLGTLPLFAAFRRFVPGSGAGTGFPWGNSPPRTLVYGAAAPRVAALTLTGAGAPRTLQINPHGGVFMAVLDGHVDPRTLMLHARLRSGATVAYRPGHTLYGERSGRPVREPPVPAYREPLPVERTEPPPFELPIASTISEQLRAPDPAGGPEWVVRSWRARPNPHANFGGGYRPSSFLCLQVGFSEGGKLVSPRASGAPQVLVAGVERGAVGGCDAPSDLTRFPPQAEAVSYVQDAFAYQPRPLRTVVAGLLREDARDAVLIGAGRPRPLKVDRNRAFLVVLPGRYWDAPLHISAIVKGRRVGGDAQGPAHAPSGVGVPEARAPDPNGGAPWGFTGTDHASATGRIVEGRFAYVDEASDQLRAGPSGTSSGGNAPIPHRGPVLFDTQGGPEPESLFSATTTFSREQVLRRTLPGRTVITGVADADVVSVTIATPRDVRTLRPSGPDHDLIVVYDGQFFRGAITASVRLRDGRTVYEGIPDGPGGMAGFEPRQPSLSARLHSDEATLAGMRSQVAKATHANPGERARILHGGSLSMIVEGYRQIQAIVAAERARIAYEQRHPGLLPAE